MIHKEKIGVSIDEISYIENNVFGLHLIPDINSEYFIPAHMRYVNVSAELLEPQYLSWISENNNLDLEMDNYTDGNGSVVQGGYYFLPRELVFNDRNLEDQIYNKNNDIFRDNKSYSPYDESNVMGELVGVDNLNIDITSEENDTILYGFYVGQGDMLLLITAAKNAYIIDTNIYGNVDLYSKISNIKKILNNNSLNVRKIKGLIITHKHLDHIRGANHLIDTKEFDIENLLMNFDYHHPTSVVKRLLVSAKSNIPKWININNPCVIVEGSTRICFRNPDKSSRLAPDINDSSIVMCIRHKENIIYLTGDASMSILEKVMKCHGIHLGSERLLKVSHHGSRTGTSDVLLNMLKPDKAFISAGTSKKYKHPHNECIKVLKKYAVNTTTSKNIRKTVEYRSDGIKITRKYI